MQTEVNKEEEDEAYGHEDAIGAMFSMPRNGEEVEGEVNCSQSLTRDFCERIASTSSGFLVAHAAEVVLFTRMTSIRKVAQYFSERFGKKISEMPIRDILHKVKTHKISVTEEQIARLGDAHPIARKFLDSVPRASDLAVSVQPFIQEAPKRRGRPRKSEPVTTKPEAGEEEARVTKDASETANPFTLARTGSPTHESLPRKFGHKEADLNNVRPEHREHLEKLMEIQQKRMTGSATPRVGRDG